MGSKPPKPQEPEKTLKGKSITLSRVYRREL